MNTKRHITMTTIAAALLAVLAGACVGEEGSDDELRMLPVAALTAEGDEVLVGTYDRDTSELALTPGFVDAIEEAGEGRDIDLVGSEQRSDLDLRGTWELDIGSTLDLVVDSERGDVVGGTLVVHPPEWTDGLTEAEAASSFGGCLDPVIPPEEAA